MIYPENNQKIDNTNNCFGALKSVERQASSGQGGLNDVKFFF